MSVLLKKLDDRHLALHPPFKFGIYLGRYSLALFYLNLAYFTLFYLVFNFTFAYKLYSGLYFMTTKQVTYKAEGKIQLTNKRTASGCPH
jgi:hypothetical protein